jgi:hypothetical protein
VPLSAEAKAIWIDFFNEHNAVMESTHGKLAAAYSKLEAYAARFALVLAMVRMVIDVQQSRNRDAAANRGLPSSVSRSVEWYCEGQSRVVEIGDMQVIIRCVGRKGRRARISITTPAGAVFQSLDLNENVRSPERSR